MKPTYSVASNPAPRRRFASRPIRRREPDLPEHALGPKIYDHYLLHIIESGHGIFRTETDRYQLGPGDCFLIHPGQIVSYVSDASHPWRYRWVAFDGEHAGEGVHRSGLTPKSLSSISWRTTRFRATCPSFKAIFNPGRRAPISPPSVICI